MGVRATGHHCSGAVVAGSPSPAAADRASWLVDNADAYRALVSAIRGARESIWLAQLALDVDCLVHDVASLDGQSSTTIVAELVAAARRGVAVRVLLNASLLLDTAKPLRAHLTTCGV